MIPMFQPLKRYADFQGRAGRAEYWSFQLLIAMTMLGASAAGRTLSALDAPPIFRGLLTGFLLTAMFGLAIPQLAVTVRRLHDVGKGGGLALFNMVALVYLLDDGQPGPNAYGDDPKGRPSPKRPLALRS